MVNAENFIFKERKRDLSILIVDDDAIITKTVAKILNSSNPNYFIESANCVEKAIELTRKTYWDTILLDLSLPFKEGEKPSPKHGLKALKYFINEINLTTPIIAITGYADDEISETVLDMGAYYFLTKPLKPKSLTAIVKNSTRFQMSGFDGLTGLLNRATFEERLKSEFERAKRKSNVLAQNKDISSGDNSTDSYLSLIFLDCDNFKEINDNFDHLAGDQILKKIGSSFIEETIYNLPVHDDPHNTYIIRPYDIACRFGGDEFSIFLPETDHENAILVARRIRDLINSYDLSEMLGQEPQHNTINKVSLSIGISTYPFPNFAESHNELIRLADAAMYESKETRKGFIYGYDKNCEIKNFS